MLSTSTHAARTYGFDNSDHFLNMAQARFPDLQFIKHDITECPFPVNGDVAYSRFVLSHLIEPVATINKWISQVRRNGTLFIDELEDIDTDSDLFTIYLSTNARLVASQGASLFVGKSLSSGIYNGEVLSNESVVLPVQNWQAATWFLPNTLTIWRASSVVSETPSDSEIQRVSNDLKRAIDTDRTKSNITWKMRHIAIRAT
jgi:trans-aconitate methyltransferase